MNPWTRLAKRSPLFTRGVGLSWIALVGLAGLAGSGCAPSSSEDETTAAPVFLTELAAQGAALVDVSSGAAVSAISTTMTLDADTRRSLSPPLGSRLAFEIALPQEPVFRFSIAGSAFGAETLPDPLEFRVHVESDAGSETVFAETLRRGQPDRWMDREVDLSAWAGQTVDLVLQSTRGQRRQGESSESPMLPLWANPVVSDSSARFDRPNIVLISIDCLRPDHLGAYGYDRETSPNVDTLAAEGVVFEKVIGTSSWSHPTHMAMLTGAPPSIHGATRWQKLDPDVAFLPEVLTEEGYRADGVVTVDYISQSFGLERGFHSYRYRFDPGATQVVDEAIRLVRQARGQNHFLFMHMLDAHWPYSPPDGYRDKFGERPEDISQLLRIVGEDQPPESPKVVQQVIDLYDGEIAYVDQELGRFFAELKRLGLYDDTLIVFTGDHGEAFYEHDYWKHTQTLYREMVQVPLIVKWPKDGPRGRFSTMVSQTDVFATILGGAGIVPPGAWSRNLHEEFLDPSPRGERTLVSEVTWDERQGVREALMKVALRNDRSAYIVTLAGDGVAELSLNAIRTEELYDLEEDPGERENLATVSTTELRGFREKLRAYFQEAKRLRASRKGEEVVLDEEALRRLRALGYVE